MPLGMGEVRELPLQDLIQWVSTVLRTCLNMWTPCYAPVTQQFNAFVLMTQTSMYVKN